METKIINTRFDIAEFEEEENWLSDMHRQGWKLAKINKDKYTFEKSPAEEWVYRLDFRKNDINRAEYIQFFNEYGWEVVLQQGFWFYFRKRMTGEPMDTTIFSDKESKIEMCERLLNGRLTVNTALFAVACLIIGLTFFTKTFSDPGVVLIPFFPLVNDFVKAALPWVAMGILVATSFSFSSYTKIKKRINRMVN